MHFAKDVRVAIRLTGLTSASFCPLGISHVASTDKGEQVLTKGSYQPVGPDIRSRDACRVRWSVSARRAVPELSESRPPAALPPSHPRRLRALVVANARVLRLTAVCSISLSGSTACGPRVLAWAGPIQLVRCSRPCCVCFRLAAHCLGGRCSQSAAGVLPGSLVC